MAEIKTKPNNSNVVDFLNKTASGNRLKDSLKLLEIMTKATKQNPVMWGSSIVGFGKYHYKYASGREGFMCAAGFSPRKNALTVYLSCDGKNYDDLLNKLGKFKKSVGCLYINKLEDVDISILTKLIKRSYNQITNKKI